MIVIHGKKQRGLGLTKIELQKMNALNYSGDLEAEIVFIDAMYRNID